MEAPGAPAKEAQTVTFGPFEFDLSLRRLTKDGEQIALTTGEFSMLKALVRHPRQPLSRDKLAQLARGREFEPFDRSLDVQISRLRKMIEPDPAQPRYIQTVWGVGYVFVPDGTASPDATAPRLGGPAGLAGSSPGRRPASAVRTVPVAMPKSPALGLTLFSRTFFLLALLLGGGIFAWVQTLRALELEPRAVQAAQQIASLVNLSRAALRYTDGINRVAVIKTMTDQESVRVLPREPGDRWEPFEVDRFTRRVGAELRARLEARHGRSRAASTASPACGSASRSRRTPTGCRPTPPACVPLTPGTWFVWVGIALLATLVGSIMIARLINQPLRELSFAASRIREGDFDSVLDENTLTSEIREVNIGFNRMARELAKVEEDRAVMLAGISHDLRTPLARLRLEAEMSVSDEEAQRNMALDIDQLDAIIDKFMDYARPGDAKLLPVQPGAAGRQGSGDLPRSARDPHRVAAGDRHPRDGRRDRARARLRQPVRERAPLRPQHRHRHRAGRRQLRPLRTLGHRQRARPRPRRGAGKAGPADDAVLPRRRGAHRRHRRRPGPGDRREGRPAHGRPVRHRQRARRRPAGPHPLAPGALSWRKPAHHAAP